MFSSRLREAAGRNRLAVALDRRRASGRPIIDLTLSNPTRAGLTYPRGILRPMAEDRSLCYEPEPFGLLSARQAVSDDLARRGLAVPASRTVLTASTSEAYSVLFKLLCDPGDAVLAPRPSYPLVEHLTDLDGVVLAHYRLEFHGRWELDLQDLREKAASERMRAIIMINPNNPTGSVMTDAELDAMASIAREHDLALISDEVFADYPMSGTPPASALRRPTALTFGLGGLSKSAGLPQVKLGWIAVGGPSPLVEDALERLETICDAYLSVSTPVQVAAPELLTAGASVRAQIQQRVRGNYAQLAALASAHPACAVMPVEAGWYAVVQVPALASEDTIVLELLDETGVLVHPGYFFDFEREAFLVLSLLPEPRVFASAAQALFGRIGSAPMMHRSRRAGISVPLFSVRSTRSWGIGEIGDIPALAGWLRAANQSVLQILPLNELAPSESSPYSALSAMAIDPQFISVWMMDEAEEFEREWRAEIEDVRQTPRIDYKAVRELKTRALRVSFERFLKSDWLLDTGRAAALRVFLEDESWWLDEYSLYRALRADLGERSWPEWPVDLRDREPSAMTRARERLAGQILFYQYVQWIAARQWQTIRQATGEIEILGDFPFMVTLDSADVWSRRQDFLLDASVGTPPDAFSETGQEWGLPPYNWDQARSNDFAWLRMRVRRQANLYDGFRVDHLVGFYRTYVRPLDGRVPFFMPSEEPEQAALGETVMRIFIDTNADVSVEDLGTVPRFVRASIARLGLPGYKVWRWEPEEPTRYPPLSVAMTGTHDTDTLAVWWETLTSEERIRFGFDVEQYDATIRNQIIEKIYNAGSNLVLLPIQDVFGWRDRINLPATISDSNWTYVLPWPSDLALTGPEAVDCANRLAGLSYQTGRWHPPLESDD